MKYRKLGVNGLLISTVGFGAWGISGRDWGNEEKPQSSFRLLVRD
jgi:aryl-alcohol dehydrogenase-like predicted oxidoreductase